MKKGDVVRGWLIGLIGIAVFAAPVSAEVRIYVTGKAAPVVTAEIFEEDGWVLYEENGSGYLFSVPRDRIEKLEIVRDGAVQTVQIIEPAPPVFPDFRPRIWFTVAALQEKFKEELKKKRDEEVGKIAGAADAVNKARQAGDALAVLEARATLAVARDAARTVRDEYERALLWLRRTLEQVSTYRDVGPKPKYYFYR